MTAPLLRSLDGASPRMLALSAALHGLLLLMVLLCSFSLQDRRPPPEEIVSRVQLVESAAGAPVVEKIQRGPVKSFEPAVPENSPEIEAFTQLSEPKRQIVQLEKLTKQELPASIRLKKRKKPPQRMEAAKKPEEKAAKKEPDASSEKKENPESFLEKRLATIRKDIESKKGDAGARPPAQDSKASPGQGSRASREGSQKVDEELAGWFAVVKGRINSHWSLPADTRPLEKVAVTSVQIAENGTLLNVAVDESSGDELFDKSAMRAVLQAAPFPPLSREASEKIRDAGGLALRFTPRGMQ